MARSNSKLCGICQSTFTDTDCIHIPGSGTVDDPYVPDFNLDTDPDNLLSKGPNGLTGTLPAIYLDPPAASVYATIDQTVPYDIGWPIFFNRRFYDTDNMWDPDEPSKLQFRTPGLYLVTLNLRWNKTNDNAARGRIAAFIRKSSNEFVALDAIHAPNGDLYPHQSLWTIVPATSEDYVEVVLKATIVSDEQDAEGNDIPIIMRVTAERQSPIFTATYLRSLDGLNIPGY